MQYYYYVYPFIVFMIIIFYGRYVIQKRKSIAARLFAEALKNENSGQFEEAVLTYQSALDEVKKTRFHTSMENKIIEKLKVLNTVIAYTNNSHFTR